MRTQSRVWLPVLSYFSSFLNFETRCLLRKSAVVIDFDFELWRQNGIMCWTNWLAAQCKVNVLACCSITVVVVGHRFWKKSFAKQIKVEKCSRPITTAYNSCSIFASWFEKLLANAMGFSSFGDTLNFFFLHFVAIVLFSLIVEIGRCLSRQFFTVIGLKMHSPQKSFYLYWVFWLLYFVNFDSGRLCFIFINHVSKPNGLFFEKHKTKKKFFTMKVRNKIFLLSHRCPSSRVANSSLNGRKQSTILQERLAWREK